MVKVAVSVAQRGGEIEADGKWGSLVLAQCLHLEKPAQNTRRERARGYCRYAHGLFTVTILHIPANITRQVTLFYHTAYISARD
jgi:hypothetical protein